MKTETLKQQTKLATYLTVTAGSGFAAIAADGATVVTLYGPGARNPSTTPATPTGVNMGVANFYSPYQVIDAVGSGSSFFARDQDAVIFTRGTDLGSVLASNNFGVYHAFNAFQYGAQAGSDNYANVSFDGQDNIHEAVAQFFFAPPAVADGSLGTGYLIAIARNDDNSALSISQGAAAIPGLLPGPPRPRLRRPPRPPQPQAGRLDLPRREA